MGISPVFFQSNLGQFCYTVVSGQNGMAGDSQQDSHQIRKLEQYRSLGGAILGPGRVAKLTSFQYTP